MSVKSDLRKLRLRTPTADDIRSIAQQIIDERNDRGAAILAATLVENAITYAIKRQNGRFAYQAAKLFENDGPIGSFDAKILIAECFGMFGPTTRHNIDIIKHVRNTFAHTPIPITFDTQEIRSACDSLIEPPIADRDGRPWASARAKFVAACYAITKRTGDYAAQCVNRRADLFDPATMIPVTPEPLP